MHANILDGYTITTSLKRFENRYKTAVDSCQANIIITSLKTGNEVGNIEFYGSKWGEDVYTDCSRIHVYKELDQSPDPDKDYGDLIVADFNFDGMPDIAYRRGFGKRGESFSVFNYFIQTRKGTFERSDLNFSMPIFPHVIDNQEKVLKSLYPESATELIEITYTWNAEKATWDIVKGQKIMRQP